MVLTKFCKLELQSLALDFRNSVCSISSSMHKSVFTDESEIVGPNRKIESKYDLGSCMKMTAVKPGIEDTNMKLFG